MMGDFLLSLAVAALVGIAYAEVKMYVRRRRNQRAPR